MPSVFEVRNEPQPAQPNPQTAQPNPQTAQPNPQTAVPPFADATDASESNVESPAVDISETPGGTPNAESPAKDSTRETPNGAVDISETPAESAPTSTHSASASVTPNARERRSSRSQPENSSTPKLDAKEEPPPDAAGTVTSGVSDVAVTDDETTSQIAGLPPKRVKEKKEEKDVKDVKETDDEEDDLGDDELLPEAQPTLPRREVKNLKNLEAVRWRTEAIHVYGLDFLTQAHMTEIFSQFSHKYFEWIDDTCANVIFQNEKSAKRALDSLSFPKANDEPWRRTPDILVKDDLPPVFLQLRLALPTDSKERKKKLPKAPEFWDALMQGVPPEQMPAFTQKRAYQKPVTEDEVAKRRKRGDRFGATLAAAKTSVCV